MKIKISDYSKTIKKSVILSEINMTLESGKIFGLRGINGSGKTMLMRAIAGLIFPDSGYIEIDGKKIGKEISFPENLGIMLENPSFINSYTAMRNLQILSMIQGKIGIDEIRDTLIRVGLNPDDKRTFRKFSLGMKQRLGIACALMEKPDIIILDEPTNSLDETGVKMVRDILVQEKQRGALIILACHDREVLEFLSDEIFEIYEGRIKGHEKVEKELVKFD